MTTRNRYSMSAISRALIVVAAVLACLPAAAQADYEGVGLFAQSGDGQQLLANQGVGIAVNTTGAGGVEAGSIYTSAASRIARYGPKGDFKEAWGWETIEAGPDLPNEVAKLTVKATSGAYTLTALSAKGEGKFTKGSKIVTEVKTALGPFHVGDAISDKYGSYIPPGTTITAVGTETLELSAPAKADSLQYWGYITAAETTAPIQAGALAAEVKATLVALSAFNAGDLSVTGGPGDAEGLTPYQVTGEGAFAGRVFDLSADDVSLAGGNPSSSVATSTIVSPHGAPPHFERCRANNGDACTFQPGSSGFAYEDVGRFYTLKGIAVDPSTGYVYVLNGIARHTGFNPGREHNLVEVFSADGSEVIARFGDAAAEGETFDASSEKLHFSPITNSGIAVDNSGKVYLSENEYGVNSKGEARVMCFRPETPGDYAHYTYCGRSQDLKLQISGSYFENLALDDEGNIYVGTFALIQEYSPAEPAKPLCTYNTNGQGRGTTVNPVTGEVFYFGSTGADKSIHRLKPCDPAKGKFEEAQVKIKASPPTQGIYALAFNPTLSWGPGRPAGVLYGADQTVHTSQIPAYQGLGYIFAQAEKQLPKVKSEWVTSTRTTSALLHAEIDPHGYGTHYAFQYLTEAQYEANEPAARFAGAAEAPLGGGEIGGSSIGQAAASLAGLTPDTAYRFRVIATSHCDVETGEPCVATGEAASFATYPAYPPGLPDHRAYELVSPAQKHGGEVLPADPHVASCGFSCKPASTESLFPMQSSPDGEALAYMGQPFSFEGAVAYDSYIAHRTATGWQTTGLVPALPPEGVAPLAFDAALGNGLRAVGVSRLELQDTAEPGSTTPLLTEAPPNRTTGFKLAYGGHSADFSRHFFAANDSLTKETPFAPEPPDPGALKNDLYEWHAGQLTLVNVAPGNAAVLAGASFASTSPDTHGVSTDGSRVFFKDEAGKLYLREDGEITRQVKGPGSFLSASPDGLQVLLSSGCLYSVLSEECTDLTEGKGGFEGLAGQSNDLTRIYFVDSAALGGGEPNEAGEVAEAGKKNLYSWSGGSVVFVAQLLVTDSDDWAANPSSRTAEASPSGRYLAFASYAPLTGYDKTKACEHAVVIGSSNPCSEAFLYDSVTNRLACASCRPSGEAALGDTTLRRIYLPPEYFPQPRYLTDEGRLYFDSADSLSARDTNEGVEDVYEYEPFGAGAQGTCQRPDGCIFLISAGTGTVDSNLLAVDETGRNVFFDTRDRLVLKDKDELLDAYVAREGGGIGAETEIARGECQGEACQAPISAPNDPTPSSSAFEGSGNVKEAKAKKGKKKHKKAHRRHARAKRNHGGAK